MYEIKLLIQKKVAQRERQTEKADTNEQPGGKEWEKVDEFDSTPGETSLLVLAVFPAVPVVQLPLRPSQSGTVPL